MAELTQKERLQPSLLDRLTDNHPDKKNESRDQRVLSIQKLRKSVLRDLEWLLNTVNLTATQNLDDYPNVARSVLNYGVPDFAGHTASSVDVPALERLLRQAIIDFEPRLLKNSVRVKLLVAESRMSHNAMTFDIEGELWAEPVPLHMYMKTEIDLEIGSVTVSDYSDRGRG
ncbi:type VI secretion system baseplate subunit TssE [endosymbiont of Ridgeia piscesae]|uniref:Type VI secretion system lysozyme-like protein n=1 Tax=endosymbiont of Ridgeia piscesae TaxID=54398 RepID=A0A0T5Z807_9GAMM|nr:type VI secretion system baseplate subunit TssE [endosymbiont of Ridgeia piscesae]KRT56438.1 type VI secretion system lysozyme-like protein [endosymbiont of Ridgeia piscesae]KRT58909.1 type VI secretion system protein ImpF [endosymbiont of Ridgeia piscesae]